MFKRIKTLLMNMSRVLVEVVCSLSVCGVDYGTLSGSSFLTRADQWSLVLAVCLFKWFMFVPAAG